jgi:hypothetical protein
MGDDVPAATFVNFLSGLAAQGLMQLGELPNPIDGIRSVHLARARYTLELIAILREKTAGNRTAEEDEYLDAMQDELTDRYADLLDGHGEAAGN